MNNPQGTQEIPLTVFGGLNSELGPTDLPAGLSPDCRDVAFLPGQTFTRPSLQRFSTLGNTAQIVYVATYVRPDQSVVQIELDSNGNIFADGVKIGATQAGNRFHTANAFGKMHIAISDGLHGVDVPLQFTAEGYLDRVSQDGPGAAPSITNYSLPTVGLVNGTTGAPIAVINIKPINLQQVQVGGQGAYEYNPPQFEQYYTSLLITTAAPHGMTASEAISVSGNVLFNFPTAYVAKVDTATSLEIPYYTQNPSIGNGGNLTPAAALLIRNNNQVTAATAYPHNLQPGYQVTIAGVPDASSALTSIVVNNETLPNVATVTTPSPHGYVPGETVAFLNVPATTVGGSITAWSVTSNEATVTTAAAHGLTVGTAVNVEFDTDGFVPRIIDTIPSATSFTFPIVTSNGTGSAGSVQLPWPLPSGTQLEIAATPTATTFTVALTTNDGTWTSGNITFPWNGTFYVTQILSPTSFAYQHTGPNAVLSSGTGTVTPSGQVAPGQRNAVCIFRTRTGYTTRPCPSVTISANGNQYLLVTNIPIGPPNVVARIIAFTGANGGNYFYLPVPPRDPSGSYLIGTSTMVNDNTTTSAIFDFADQELFAGLAIDIPGNNLFRQEILGPCLGFYSYASRLMAWGERNRIQQYLNMGFEGGVYASNPTQPLGWTVEGQGYLVPGDYGMGWRIVGGGTGVDGTISQSAYRDQFGIQIVQPNTQYTFRLWLQGNGAAQADLFSPSVGVLASAIVGATVNGGWGEAKFTGLTGIAIPSDTRLRVYAIGLAAGQQLVIDELEQLYPYLLTCRSSYVNNPEAFDGVTGNFGPANTKRPVMGMEELDDVLSVFTSGPDGGHYQVEDTASGEPSSWTVRQKGEKCGLTSVWGIAKFEDWLCWTSDTGLRIFAGSQIEKLSQEVQPWFDSINPAAKQFTVLANDPTTRRIYVLAPTGTATVPNDTYVLDYRELNTEAIFTSSGSLHVSSYSGKMITTDLTRKWAPWSLTMNYCTMLSLPNGSQVMAFCGGTGGSLSDPANSAVYTLNEGVISGIDADYGPFWQNSYYTTYFFIPADDAQQRQLGLHRLLHNGMTLNIEGVGTMFVVPQINRLGNVASTTRPLQLSSNLARDLEIWFRDVAGERVAYKIGCQPAGLQPAPATAQAGFRISNLNLSVRTHPYSPIRGKNS